MDLKNGDVRVVGKFNIHDNVILVELHKEETDYTVVIAKPDKIIFTSRYSTDIIEKKNDNELLDIIYPDFSEYLNQRKQRNDKWKNMLKMYSDVLEIK